MWNETRKPDLKGQDSIFKLAFEPSSLGTNTEGLSYRKPFDVQLGRYEKRNPFREKYSSTPLASLSPSVVGYVIVLLCPWPGLFPHYTE